MPVVCDLSDPSSVQRAAAEILALDLPVAGLLNNAGVSSMNPSTNRLGWDTTFATNHLGPFALTEALAPHLPDGANVVFICSAVEDPDRKFATMAGFRGGRSISAEASARGGLRRPRRRRDPRPAGDRAVLAHVVACQLGEGPSRGPMTSSHT